MLPPGGPTRIDIRFMPVTLGLRTDNAFEVTLDAGGDTLRAVAQVTTPERHPVR